jgi:hypothetical protein
LTSVAIAFLPYQLPPEPPIGSADSEVLDLMSLRIAVKTRLIAELAAGQRSLFETAALFDALDGLPGAPLPLTVQDSNLPAPERACRHVIEWVESQFDGPDGDATVTRLKSELRIAREQSGGFVLPDPNSVESIERLLAAAREMVPAIKNGKR